VIASVLIRFGNDPRWRVGNSDIKHLSRGNDIIQRMHEFRDGAGVVPPVDI